MVTMHGVAEAAYLLDDSATAARVYELLRPYGHLPIVGSLAVACFGSAHHALGVAALTMGDVDRAVTHLRESVRQNLALAHWPRSPPPGSGSRWRSYGPGGRPRPTPSGRRWPRRRGRGAASGDRRTWRRG